MRRNLLARAVFIFGLKFLVFSSNRIYAIDGGREKNGLFDTKLAETNKKFSNKNNE